jgi:hypothetical protein
MKSVATILPALTRMQPLVPLQLFNYKALNHKLSALCITCTAGSAKCGCCDVGAAHFNHDSGVCYNNKCSKCAEPEIQLKEMHTELSSLQLLVKSLYKEINSITSTCNMDGNTNPPSSSFSFKESRINAGAQKRRTVV